MGNQVKKKKILIQIVCVLLSFGLWIYINTTENPIGQKTVNNVPVEILNTGVLAKDGLALAPNQKVTVNLNIKGPNEKILFDSNPSDYKVILPLGSTQLSEGSNWLTAQVVGTPNGVTVSNQLIKVNLKLEPLIKKDLPVTSEIRIDTASGVYVKNLTLSPETVTVEGAESAVNSVSKIAAIQKLTGVSKGETVTANLIALNDEGQKVDDVTITPNTVNAQITVNNGKIVPINVVTTGTAPSGVDVKSIVPSMKNIELIGDEKDLSGINSINTSPINLSNVTPGKQIQVSLVIPKGLVTANNVNSINVTIAAANNEVNENQSGVNTGNENENNQGNNGNNNNNNSTGTEVDKTFTVPIQITGEKKGYKYTLSNKSVSVVLRGDASAMSTLNNSSLNAMVDVSNLDGTANVKLVFNTPDSLSVVSITPAEVTVTATKSNVTTQKTKK